MIYEDDDHEEYLSLTDTRLHSLSGRHNIKNMIHFILQADHIGSERDLLLLLQHLWNFESGGLPPPILE